MSRNASHISDQDLILSAGGELSRSRASEIQAHLTFCWTCRARMQELKDSMANFARAYRESFEPQLPSSHTSRAVLKARLNRLAVEFPEKAWWRAIPLLNWRRLAYSCGSLLVVLIGLTLWQSSKPTLALSPDPRLTPGAALSVTETDICTKESGARSRLVLASVGKRVFEEYGIRNPQPRRYELDYLIDPDLGGSDDERNLWPQPYSAQWNAHVKDALEGHLRQLVCTGKITLAQAQHDISTDWISAYKKYFQTDRPKPDHLNFHKDQPWE